MKTLVAAIVFLVLVVPAHASSPTEWDCGEGIRVSYYRGEFGVFTRYATEGDPHPGLPNYRQHGVQRYDLKWDFQNNNVRVNGRKCTLVGKE